MFALHRPERHLRRDTFAWRADGVERPSPRTRGSGPTCGGGHSSLLQSPHQDARCGPNAPVPPTAHLSLSRGRRDIKSEGGRGWPGWGLLFPFRPYWAEEGQLREPAGKRAVLVTAPPVAARRPPHTRGLAVPHGGTEAAAIPGGPSPAWGPCSEGLPVWRVRGQFGVCGVWFNSQKKCL